MSNSKPYDTGRIILVSQANIKAWIETGLRSMGEIPDSVDKVFMKFGAGDKVELLNGVKIGDRPDLVPIELKLKNVKEGVLIEH